MQNKHNQFLSVCETIWYDIKKSDFEIIKRGDWTYCYWKRFKGKILKDRSCTEIIFKPLFMRKLKAYLVERFWKEDAIKIILELVWTQYADRFLYNVTKDTYSVNEI